MELAPTHTIMEAAKALGGSFKLVALAPKTDSTAQGNIKEWGHTNKSKSTILNEHTKHKPRLNTVHKKTLGSTGCEIHSVMLFMSRC